jgi:four helix bundle protein
MCGDGQKEAGNHVAGQLLRSGTAPLPMHGEAQAAESSRDFQHILRIALKEPREMFRRLKLKQRTPLIKPAAKLDALRPECDELVRILSPASEPRNPVPAPNDPI